MNTELQRKREQYLKLLKELRAQGEVSDENYRKSQRKLFLRRLETLRALGKVSDKVYRKLDEEYSVASEEAKTEEVLDAVDLEHARRLTTYPHYLHKNVKTLLIRHHASQA